MRVVGDADTARLRNPFKTCGDIDTIAEDIVVIDDDVADVNADPKFDPLGLRHGGILLDHAALDLDGASRRIDGAGKLDQHAVTGRLDDPPTMRSDGGIDEGLSDRL